MFGGWTMPAYFFRSEPGAAELRRLARQESGRVCQRVLMIANLLEGMEHEEAARLAGLSRSAAYEWHNRHEEDGIAGLRAHRVWDKRASPPVIGAKPVAKQLRSPFANLGNDPNQQYFADGITEDLTTDLSRIEDMFVISRNTAFTYKDKPVDTKQIGRELGVRYVLEGSVRRSGNHVRVNAQLIDAETDAHLWAERNLEVLAAEVARATENNPDALDYILQGRAALAQPPGVDSYGEAINSFRARAGTRSAVRRGEGLVGKCTRRPHVRSSPELILERFETRGGAGKPSLGGIAR